VQQNSPGVYLSSAQRYYLRAPRYVLKSAELRNMRFATMETRGLSTATEVMNLSESGLAFQLETGRPPEEGDILKVEFPIPGETQIACFATVVRVDEFTDWDPKIGERRFNVVGLKFRHLPDGHRRILRRGLDGRAASENETSASLSDHKGSRTPSRLASRAAALASNLASAGVDGASKNHSLRDLIFPVAGLALSLLPLMYVMTLPTSVIISAIRHLLA
jgi:hypothetical protein